MGTSYGESPSVHLPSTSSGQASVNPLYNDSIVDLSHEPSEEGTLDPMAYHDYAVSSLPKMKERLNAAHDRIAFLTKENKNSMQRAQRARRTVASLKRLLKEERAKMKELELWRAGLEGN